jgi:hypothetical protein
MHQKNTFQIFKGLSKNGLQGIMYVLSLVATGNYYWYQAIVFNYFIYFKKISF